MSRWILIFLVFISTSTFGQITHLTDLDFKKVPWPYDSWKDPFLLFSHGDYLIITYNDYQDYQCKVVHLPTGEIVEPEFSIIRQVQIGEERAYAIVFPQNLGLNARFLPPDGFTNYPFNLPYLFVEHNGAGYYIFNGEFRRFQLNPYENTVIADLSDPRYSNYGEIEIASDTAIIAMDGALLKISLLTGEIVEPHRDLIEELSLVLLPETGLNNSYLYRSASADELAIYELRTDGHFRQFFLDSVYPNVDLVSWDLDRGNVASGGNYTYLHFRIGEISEWYWNQILLKFDRGESGGSASTIGDFSRYKYEEHFGAAIWPLNDGNSPVVNGLLGPEGNEPYGMVNDSLQVLADMIPGILGSVDYEIYADRNEGRTFDNTFTWSDKAIFLAGQINYGVELSVSDGTPEGTGMLTDLVPGSEGLRHVQFLEHGPDSLILFVQRDDLSYGVYLMGKQLPSPIRPQIPEGISISSLGNFPENKGVYSTLSVPPLLVEQSKDGSLFYLSPSSFWGHAVGDDGPAPEFFRDDFQGARNLFRLQKVNNKTGELEFSKTFASASGGGHNYREEKNLGLAVLPDDKILVLKSLRRGYVDENNIVGGSSGDLTVTTFSEDGEFQDVQTLPTEFEHREILSFEVLNDGKMVALTRAVSAFSTVYHMVMISPQSELLAEIRVDHKGKYPPNLWKSADGETFTVATYHTSSFCNDLEVRFNEYTSSLLRRDLGRFCFSGDLISPQVFEKSNGNRIYSGAARGSLFLSDINAGFPVGNGEGLYTGFVYETSTDDPSLNRISTLTQNATHFFNAIDYNGERYFQYIEEGDGQHYFITSQLDGNLLVSDQFRQKILIKDPTEEILVSSGVFEDRWWQFTSTGNYNQIWVDTILAPPLFRFNRRERMGIHRPWPFHSSTITPTEPQEETNLYQVYPNPSRGEFYIRPMQIGQISPYQFYEVYDNLGKLVLKGVLPKVTTILQISIPGRSATGVFQLRLIGGDHAENHRLIVI